MSEIVDIIARNMSSAASAHKYLDDSGSYDRPSVLPFETCPGHLPWQQVDSHPYTVLSSPMYPHPDAKHEHVPYPPAHKVIFIYAGNNMDTDFYSEQAIKDFIKKTLCQGDSKLFAYYIAGNVQKFRERLSRKFGPDQQKNLEFQFNWWL